MNIQTNNIVWNTTNNGNQVFQSILVNKEDLLENLKNNLNKTKQECSKEALSTILHKNDEKELKKYSTKVFNKIYKNKDHTDLEVQKWMKLFQTAFIEMEWLFWNMPRREGGWKTWFNHLLWVLENILAGPNPTIKQCILTMLHDSAEDIPWYTVQHIKEVYGPDIANSVNNMTKEPLEYYLRIKHEDNKQAHKYLEDPTINSITRKYRKERYYGGIPTRWSHEDFDEIIVKFADRLNSLQTMYIKQLDGTEKIDKKYLIKKLSETEKYFLIPELKEKASDFHYTALENKFTKRKKYLNNKKNNNILLETSV